MTYTSADFDTQRTGDYTLLAKIGADEQVLAVVDQGRQLKWMTTYDAANAGPAVSDMLRSTFAQVKVSVLDSRHLFVPADAFDDAYQQTYFRFLPDDGIRDSAVSDIPQLDIKLLHQTSKLGLELFIERFPEINVYPSIQVLLRSVASYGIKTEGAVLTLDKQSSQMTLCCFNGGKLIYSNDFDLRSTDDLNYYLAAVFEHLQLVDQPLTISLSGDIVEGDEYYQLLLRYGDAVLFADSGSFTGVALPDGLVPHQHRFLTLFGLVLCG